MRRIIYVGNTEEQFRFCPQEILYANMVKGQEKMEIHLLNKSTYTVNSTLGEFVRTIDEAVLLCNGFPFIQVGRSLVVNHAYTKKAENQQVFLRAEVEGNTIEDSIPISKAACDKLSEYIGKNIFALTRLQKDNRPEGYREVTHAPGGGLTGFLMREFVPIKRTDEYYDLDDDEIQVLGV